MRFAGRIRDPVAGLRFSLRYVVGLRVIRQKTLCPIYPIGIQLTHDPFLGLLDPGDRRPGVGRTNDGRFEDIQEVGVERLCAAMIVSPRALLPFT
jgi:hypothetical protein